MSRRLTLCLAFCLSATLYAAPPASGPQLMRADAAPVQHWHFSHMSTTVTVSIVGPVADAAEQAVEEIDREFGRIEALMSEWRGDSEVSQINAAAGAHPVIVSPELFRLLAAAVNIGQETQGSFDISFWPLGALWDFHAQQIPEQSRIHQARQLVDYRELALDSKSHSAYLRRKGMRIGLGGIAKGYAVDRAVQILKAGGVQEFAVNAGGDLYVAGPAQSRRWRVGIRDPRDPSSLRAVLPVVNAAVATSGDYERFFIHEGQRYSHLIDPASGYPAQACQSATIVTARTFQADALSTAMFVLGPQRGLEVLKAFPDTEALIIDAAGKPYFSSGLRPLSTRTIPADSKGRSSVP